MRILVLLFVLAFSSCAGSNGSEGNRTLTQLPDHLATTIDDLVAQEMDSTHLPGVAVVLVKDGKTIFKRGYGLANVETGQPVDVDQTLFRIGSVSKALTALAVTRLADGGRINFDDDITQYFDQIQNMGGFEEPVTIKNLLTHTAGFDQVGLGRHIYDFDQPLATRKAMRQSLEEYLADGNLRRVTPPGQLFRYDTYGITLAGYILGKVTGMSYAKAMEKELFDPLGMTNSFVEADDEHFDDLATGYGWVDDAYVPQPYEVYLTTPASSIDATPADMGRLLEAITGGGANGHGKLYSTQTAAAVMAPQYRPHPKFTGISHGFWESPSVAPPNGPAVHSITHGGSMLGYSTSVEIFTEKKLGVFVVTNRDYEAGGGGIRIHSRIAEAVIDAFYESPPAIQVTDAVPVKDRDLSEYEGDYAMGTFCKSCSRAEFERGAWRARYPREVEAVNGGLVINGELFSPTKDKDVFVSEAILQEVFFGRNQDGDVAFYVTSNGPMSFEKVNGFAELREALDAGRQLTANNQLNKAKEAIAEALELGVNSGLYTEYSNNVLGYQLLGNQEIQLALLVFEVNVNLFPASWNVYDSLGEALAEAGRTQEAVTAYKQSIQLNPENENGKAALERLQANK